MDSKQIIYKSFIVFYGPINKLGECKKPCCKWQIHHDNENIEKQLPSEFKTKEEAFKCIDKFLEQQTINI